MPPTSASSANTTASAVASRGFAVTRAAAAPGATITESTMIAPTIGTASAVTRPMSTAKTGDSMRTGTPRAIATSGSVLANSSGRWRTASTASTTTATPPSTPRLVESTDTIDPVSSPNLFDARPG